MTEEVREYVEIKSNSSDETSIELKIPQAQSLNYLAYNCLASLEFMISTIILIFYVALNTSTTLIVLSGLGLLALSAGCLLSFFAVSKLDPKKQTYALIAFCVASLLGFTTAVISLTLTFRGYKPLLNTTFYSRNLSDESYNTPYGHASTSTLYNYGYNSYNYPYISSYYSASNNGYSNYYNSDPVYSYESSPYYSSSYYSGYNPGYDSYNPYSSYTYYSPYSSDYRYSQPYYYYSQYSYPSYSSYYPYNYPYSYSYNYPYYNEYSSSSSSVSYSYSYSYTYSDPYHHTVSYSYSYSSWSSQYGSSYSTSTSYNDYSPYYQYPYSSYWFTESTSSSDGSTYTSYNPYTGSRFSSVTYQSPDPNMYREVPSMIFESSKHVDGSSAINMLWSILFFVIQGLLFVALITQANLLRKNLREKKLLTFDQSILRSEPQKI